jgi:hypothetical protein
VGFVLGQDHDLTKTRVDQVRNSEINEPVMAGKGDGGFGTVGSERHQSLALTPGENYSEHFWCRHTPSVADGDNPKPGITVE